MKSLRWSFALWFTVSLLAVLGCYVCVTYLHLRHELRVERWERNHPTHPDWTLHGSYSETEVDDIAGELLKLSLGYAVPVALIALGLGYLLAKKSFNPVAALNRQLQEIGVKNLKQHIQLKGAGSEFREIETSINALLTRLENSFAQMTEYSAQVAHELRTPLTLLRLQLEDAAGRIEPVLAESLQEELAHLSDYVDQCLLLAKAEQGRLSIRAETVHLGPLIQDLLEAYQHWANKTKRKVTFHADENLTVVTDPRYLRQLLHALLTNSIKHGAGPIQIRLCRSGTLVTCDIMNEMAPHHREQSGIGLGLRIARAIASTLCCSLKTGCDGTSFRAVISWGATQG